MFGDGESFLNYLAHLLVAEHTQTSLIGNFLGDFVKGPVDDLEYPASIKRGIRLHRAVDVFTDSHPIFLQSRARISSKRRRYAGIIVDLAYDHFLSLHWKSYSQANRSEFINDFYRTLEYNLEWLPMKCKSMARPMIQNDWLGQYHAIEGIAASINGISRRINHQFNRDNPLFDAIEEVEADFNNLANDFNEFFPLLLQFAREQ